MKLNKLIIVILALGAGLFVQQTKAFTRKAREAMRRKKARKGLLGEDGAGIRHEDKHLLGEDGKGIRYEDRHLLGEDGAGILQEDFLADEDGDMTEDVEEIEISPGLKLKDRPVGAIYHEGGLE